MKSVLIALIFAAAMAMAASGGSAPHPAAAPSRAPTVTKTIIKEVVPVTPSPTTPPATTSAPAPSPVPNVTDPWGVVLAYCGDVESGNYPEAWALLSSGAVTGQTYQQFVSGYACAGSQQLTELRESGDQVSFNLAATDDCAGVVRYHTRTDTVVAAGSSRPTSPRPA